MEFRKNCKFHEDFEILKFQGLKIKFQIKFEQVSEKVSKRFQNFNSSFKHQDV